MVGKCCLCGRRAKGLIVYEEFVCYRCHYEATGERPFEGSKQSSVKKTRKLKEEPMIIEYNGESHGTREWSRITGINRTTILKRIRRGWSVERALTEKALKENDK